MSNKYFLGIVILKSKLESISTTLEAKRYESVALTCSLPSFALKLTPVKTGRVSFSEQAKAVSLTILKKV